MTAEINKLMIYLLVILLMEVFELLSYTSIVGYFYSLTLFYIFHVLREVTFKLLIQNVTHVLIHIESDIFFRNVMVKGRDYKSKGHGFGG